MRRRGAPIVTEALSPATMVLGGGLILSTVFGWVARSSHFCVMGAISDAVNMEHWGRMRLWMLALAVAITGTNLLAFFGRIDLGKSLYQRPLLPWLSLLLGGLAFGWGMTLAGGCPNRNLLRLGAGSLRSLVVLVFVAIASYMALKGLFAQWRVSYLDPMAIDLSAMGLAHASLPDLFARWTGMAQPTALLVVSAAALAGLGTFCFQDAAFRRDVAQIVRAALLGLLVVAAWYLSGHIGYGENPDTLETVYFATNSRTLESLSFVAPTAYSLELLLLWTDKSLHPSFGVACVAGVVLGAFAHAIGSKQFRWEGFGSLQDLRNQLTGAMLMGFGGVTAVGCTIGQGLSGLSTLAIGSLIAVAGIVCGCIAAMRWLSR